MANMRGRGLLRGIALAAVVAAFGLTVGATHAAAAGGCNPGAGAPYVPCPGPVQPTAPTVCNPADATVAICGGQLVSGSTFPVFVRASSRGYTADLSVFAAPSFGLQNLNLSGSPAGCPISGNPLFIVAPSAWAVALPPSHLAPVSVFVDAVGTGGYVHLCIPMSAIESAVGMAVVAPATATPAPAVSGAVAVVTTTTTDTLPAFVLGLVLGALALALIPVAHRRAKQKISTQRRRKHIRRLFPGKSNINE